MVNLGHANDTQQSDQDLQLTPMPPVPKRAGNHGGTITPFTSASASAAAKRRWELRNARVRRGVGNAKTQIDQIAHLPGNAPLDVIEYLAEQHTLNAADPSAHGSQASYKLVMDYGWPRPDASQDTGNGASITINMSAGAMVELARALGYGAKDKP